MTGNEAFKQMRIDAGYTYRAFAAQAGIPLSLLYGYESGSKEICSIPVAKAIRIFSLSGKNMTAFYLENYDLKQEVLQNIEIWKQKHPPELHIEKLMKQLKNRIAKLKGRGRLTEDAAARFNQRCNDIVEDLTDDVSEDGCISEERYEQHVIPLMADIKTEMFCDPGILPTENKLVIDAMYQKNWGYSGLAEICGLSRQHLKYCLCGKGDLFSMHIGTALKLCIALELPFEKVFRLSNDNK